MKMIAFLIVFFTLFVAGCSETVVMHVRKDIDRPAVSVSKDIKVPRTMSNLRGMRMSGFLIFPEIVTDEIDRQEGESLDALVKQHNIDIAEIVLNSFIKNFENFAPYRIDSRAKTIIKLQITGYGISDEGFFYSTKMLPYLMLYVEMINEDGDVLWDELVSASGKKSGAKAVDIAEIKKNPNILREMWSLAADAASRDIIQDMPADLITE
jgi:hypothetical protein